MFKMCLQWFNFYWLEWQHFKIYF